MIINKCTNSCRGQFLYDKIYNLSMIVLLGNWLITMVSCLFRHRASDRGCIICLTHPPSPINPKLIKSIWWRSAIVILLAQIHKNSDWKLNQKWIWLLKEIMFYLLHSFYTKTTDQPILFLKIFTLAVKVQRFWGCFFFIMHHMKWGLLNFKTVFL